MCVGSGVYFVNLVLDGIKPLLPVLNEKKLQEVDSLWKEFETPEKANKIVKLKHFEKFQDTTEALAGK
uniref:Nucleolar protein 58/56 N-terminal domain-containing protein n=1 Tax=Strix occidentalis caurina TaxID=311401 RepID=A0A8D0KZ31_STROC